MVANAAVVPDGLAAATLNFLDSCLAGCNPAGFAIRLWNGNTWSPRSASDSPRVTIVLRHPGALRSLFSGHDIQMAETYLYGGLDLEGHVEAVFELADALIGHGLTLSEKLRAARVLSRFPAWKINPDESRRYRASGPVHSKNRDRRAIAHHYDIANEFYKLWLDRRMVYSCAYFQSAGDDLDTAQLQKLDYICSKLRLRNGERLLDLGCGWGGLVLHAAGEYGAQATGTTISQAQADFANELIQAAGLAGRCRVEARDYREVEEWGTYDKIVSVGMFEHVGQEMLPEYFSRAFRLLRPGGVFLNHGIARGGTTPIPKRPNFVSEYVFPDGELVTLTTTLGIAEAAGFEIRDVESLREHYVLTLREWVRRLEANAEAARSLTDEVTYRLWRLYMSGSAHWFKTARNNVYQVLLRKPDNGCAKLPLTRADWYAHRYPHVPH